MSTSRWFLTLAWLAIGTAVSLAPAAHAAGAGAVMAYDLAIANNSNLEFGVIVPSATAGAVKMTPTGTRSVLPLGACLFLEIAPLRGAAGFDVEGAPAKTFSISLPTAVVKVTRTGGLTMDVDTFKSSPQNTGTIDTDGTQSIAVGATLRVGAAQATGRYTGTFNVTIAYN